MSIPPLLLGSAEEVLEQLKTITSIKPECIARISIAPHTFESLIEVMQVKLDEFKTSEKIGESDE